MKRIVCILLLLLLLLTAPPAEAKRSRLKKVLLFPITIAKHVVLIPKYIWDDYIHTMYVYWLYKNTDR